MNVYKGMPSSSSKEKPVIAMDMLISMHSTFTKELRQSLHSLYLAMIVDYTFKVRREKGCFFLM